SDLVRVPVALEVGVVVPHGHLAEVQRIFDVSGEIAGARPEGQRAVERRPPDLQPAVRPKGVHVPVDVVDIGHPANQVPTSAQIAPGPSTCLPSSESVTPTMIEILPRCLFSCSSW